MRSTSIVKKVQFCRSSLSFPLALVVGYDQIYNQEIKKKLQLCSFQVTTLTQPSIAISLLRKLKSGYFQLLLIDIDKSSHPAPFMNLKQFSLQMGLPVVMISRQENHSLMKKMLKSGVSCFLIKPINVELLRSTCDQYALKKNLLLRNAISKIRPKRERIIWDLDVHHRFLEVISKLEPSYCTPLNILCMMNVPGLTRKNVSSHLQNHLSYLKKFSDGEHFSSYSMPGKILPSRSSSILTPKVENFDNISLKHDQSTTKNLRNNINLMSNRRNIGMYETGLWASNPINANAKIQKMSIDKDGNDFFNFNTSENLSILNKISNGITSNNHHPKFTLLNFNNDTERPISHYPLFHESYDQVPDSSNFAHTFDQMIHFFEPKILDSNQFQPKFCFANVEPNTSLEFDSSNFEYPYSVVGNPSKFSNSDQVTNNIKNDVQWVIGNNPNKDGVDEYSLFDSMNSFNITQGSYFPSQQFDEIDFEGLFS